MLTHLRLRQRPAWLVALVTAALLLSAFGFGVLVSHSGAFGGAIAFIVSIPQFPGLLVLSILDEAYVSRFGSLPPVVGSLLTFVVLFGVQWALITVLVVLNRRPPLGASQ